ncbi:hypothetical protein ACIPY5_19830 [Microbacterium sp. NPDC089698]|uniref:hypothetical protein n=1 Tax=Microbacterium sp. NPDC089698 TaxID=3364200 RepID=UPI0038084195
MNIYVDEAPEGVTVYASAIDYWTEDPSRRSGFNIPGDVGGYDAIHRVLHSDGSEWRVSILNGVVYAILRRFPHERRYTFAGPVWEITTLPAGFQWRTQQLARKDVRDFFFELEQRYRREPDSLHTVVRRIQRWAADLPSSSSRA